MPNDNSGGSDDFRTRLAHIPNIAERPLDDPWLGQTTPSPRRESVADPLVAPIVAPPVVTPPTFEPAVSDPRPAGPDDDPYETIVYEYRRRRWPWAIAGLFTLLLMLVAVPVAMAWRTFDSIERVDLGGALVPAETIEGVNVLLVGTDSREGISDDIENAGLILGGGIGGQRSDTIMVLRIADDGTAAFLSLPRDLWLPIAGGGEQRINTAIARGPAAVVATVQDELGIPITNYVEIDLAGFIELVDAVGGVTITIPNPAFDRASGLDLPVAGEVTLDSAQALAYVRSRRYTEIIDGRERVDGTSDLGRVQRQQDFLRAMFGELTAERNPFAVSELVGSMGDAVKIDEQTSFRDVLGIARSLRSGLPESVVLPTSPTSIGGNSVLLLGPGADEQLALFAG